MTKKKRNESVMRHFFIRCASPDSRMARVITRRPVIIFLVVLFFIAVREPKLLQRDASIEIVRGGWLTSPALGVEDERRVARVGRDSRQLIVTPEKSLRRCRRPHAYADTCMSESMSARVCMCVYIRTRVSGKLAVLYVTMRNLRVVRRLFAGR